jgi:hypothetical protein
MTPATTLSRILLRCYGKITQNSRHLSKPCRKSDRPNPNTCNKRRSNEKSFPIYVVSTLQSSLGIPLNVHEELTICTWSNINELRSGEQAVQSYHPGHHRGNENQQKQSTSTRLRTKRALGFRNAPSLCDKRKDARQTDCPTCTTTR